MDEVSLNTDPVGEDDAEDFEFVGDCAMTEYVGQTGIIQNPLPPAVAMEFETYEDVYYFYNCYAKEQGFGVRVSNTWYRKSKEKYRGKLSCSSAGFKKKSEANRPRPETRTGCPAMIKFRLMENKRWRIIEVELEHNHLISPSSGRFYKSHKHIGLGTKRTLPLVTADEVQKIRLFRTVIIDGEGNGDAEANGEFGNNVNHSNQLKLKPGDAQAVQNFFCRMQLKDPNFFNVVDLNEKGCLRNLFWTDSRSRVAYKYFGDVVSIDTTYLADNYDGNKKSSSSSMATATATTATPLSSFSSLSISLHTTPRLSFLSTTANQKPTTRLLPKLSLCSLICRASSSSDKPPTEIDTSFFENFNPNADEDVVFDPPTPPEDYVSPPSFDDLPEEDEEEIAAAYEELYGPAYSGTSVLGKDINVMDSKVKKTGALGKTKKEKIKDGFDERVVQVRRVTKVVKGGKQLRFRAIVVVGDKKGQVGVGVGKAKEVIAAVQKSAVNARRNIITVPMTKYLTFPHRSDGDYGAAKVMLRPASPGTGVIAGGAVRIVLEMAGVENALGKQIGSNNALNNARATVVAVQKMRQFRDVARDRGIPMEELWK